MSELETQLFNVLKDHSEYFVADNLFITFFRWIIWNLVKILMSLVDILQNVFLDIWKLPELFTSEAFTEIREPFVYAMYGIASLSLTIYAIRRMISSNMKTQTFIDSLLLGTGTVLLSTILIGELLTVSTQISEQLINLETGTSYVYKIIEETGTDTLKAIRNNFDKSSSGITLTPETIKYFDYGQIITENYIKELEVTESLVPIEGLGDDWFKVFNYGIGLNTVDNSPSLNELNGFIGTFLGIERGYYRYNMSIGAILLYLFTYLIVIFLCLLKYVQLFFEIAITQTLLPLFTYTDLDGAKDLKKILSNLKNAMLTMVLCALSLKVFSVFQYWVAEQNFGIVTIIIFQIGISLAVIDGANIIQELTGYDAGVKSVSGALIAGGQVIGGVARAGSAIGKATVGLGKGTVATTKGAINLGGGFVNMMKAMAESDYAAEEFGFKDSKERYIQDKMKGFNSDESQENDHASNLSNGSDTSLPKQENDKQNQPISAEQSNSSYKPAEQSLKERGTSDNKEMLNEANRLANQSNQLAELDKTIDDSSGNRERLNRSSTFKPMPDTDQQMKSDTLADHQATQSNRPVMNKKVKTNHHDNANTSLNNENIPKNITKTRGLSHRDDSQ